MTNSNSCMFRANVDCPHLASVETRICYGLNLHKNTKKAWHNMPKCILLKYKAQNVEFVHLIFGKHCAIKTTQTATANHITTAVDTGSWRPVVPALQYFDDFTKTIWRSCCSPVWLKPWCKAWQIPTAKVKCNTIKNIQHCARVLVNKDEIHTNNWWIFI